MGNANSAPSMRRNLAPTPSESNEIPPASNVRLQDDTSQTPQMSTDIEEGTASVPHVVQRRRSLMKFPSLRGRSRSAIGLNEHNTDPQVLGPTSPSRRRWRAFSGLKSRPISTMAAPNPPATQEPSPQGTPCHSIPESAPSEKGKERQMEEIAEDGQADESGVLQVPQDVVNEPGSSATGNDPETSPDAMLQELRDLQDTMTSGDAVQPDTAAADATGEASGGSGQSRFDRPPTPVPASHMGSTSGLRGGDVADPTSHTGLAEALGSWMSGRLRSEDVESASNDAPMASSARSPEASSSSTYSSPRLGRSSGSNSAPRLSQAARALDSPFLSSVSPERPSASTSGSGQTAPLPGGSPQERRTLPPAGTGTLVVVQGIVHTTDVRHPHSRMPTTSWPSTAPASSPHPPRSVSSTPTLRPPSPGMLSRSGSRASTPQPPSTPRRGRFSSLTSGLRQRSRPRTPTSLRNAGLGGWRHSVADPGLGNRDRSDTAFESGFDLDLSPTRGASDSETGSGSHSGEFSSAGGSALTDDTSTLASTLSPNERQDARDPATSPGNTRMRNDQADAATSNSDHVGDRPPVDDGEHEGNTDEDSEAELSASSIEVLGTLLSVATAATAASLVTGTTEPLFSSGLAGPPVNARNVPSAARSGPTLDSMPSSSHSGPSSLHSNPSSESSSAGADNSAEAAANTRMRAAWESLRDRFSRTRGRRGETPGEVPGDTREDPREQMLREMARAFNLGLGLDAERPRQPGGPQQDRLTDVTSGGSGHPPPETLRPPPEIAAEEPGSSLPGMTGAGSGPEGSFEQFLHNLQVDLRTALTQDYAARRARAQARNSLPASSPSSISNSRADTENPPSSSANNDPTSEDSRPQVPASSADTAPRVPEYLPPVSNTPRTANLDLPLLPGDINPRHTDGSGGPPQAQGITGQPGAGINWWRLYRFPPMQLAPHPTSADTSTGDVPSTPSPLSPTSSEHTSGASLPEPHSSSIDSSSPLSGSETPSPTQNVVPVIVVGLQSVPVNRTRGPHTHHHDPPISRQDTEPSLGTSVPTDVHGRDRGWPLRAASRAFNRMGRRADTDLPPDGNMTSSSINAAESTPGEMTPPGRQSGRTYLIFVIGGYYPPNHSIVTGADDMNSFEALWELADLLGQVKPPVASKEDIERSGLEIIKASYLSEYEKLGKVAANTVERCLICLDDYEPQDDLRLLSCRHVFHKQCVDRWLEQGRNNCPACRSKGVRTGDDFTTSPSPAADVPSETL